MTAIEFQSRYWELRRELMAAGEPFAGEFGRIVGQFETAVNSYSEQPDPLFSEIDEEQLRREAKEMLAALESLS